MNEMLHRVTVAIAVANSDENCEYQKMARAAIEAMREPTVEMLTAAQEDWMCVRAAEERGDFIWRAMIDEAVR